MGKSKAPPAPDYAAAAKQQGQDNLAAAQQTAALNRPTQIDSNGSQTWSLREGADPKNPQAGDWIVTNKLNETQQALKDQQDALSSQFGSLAAGALKTVGDTMSTKFDISGLPQASAVTTNGLQQWETSPQSQLAGQGQRLGEGQQIGPAPTSTQFTGEVPNAAGSAPMAATGRASLSTDGLRAFGNVDPTSEESRQRITDALYRRQTSMLDPQTTQQSSDLTSRLAAQGITEGSPAYQRAMDNQARQQREAYQSARDAAILAGGAEDSRIGQQNLNVANFQNATRGQEFGERGTVAGFNNNNLDTVFNQEMQRAKFNQDANAQAFSNSMLKAGFNNAANTTDFQSQLQAAGFNNADELARAGFNNADELARLGFNNDAAMRDASFNNQLRGQQANEQLAMTSANNTLHNNAVQEALMQRQLGMNEANALRTGNQVGGVNFQAYGGGGQVQAGDYQGAVQQQYNAALAANNANNANVANTWGGITGLATAGMNNAKALSTIISDRRLKTQIKRVGTHILGIGFYEWVYVWGEKARGVMAQEVLTVKPEAVVVMPNGFYAVDYKVLGA